MSLILQKKIADFFWEFVVQENLSGKRAVIIFETGLPVMN